MTLERGVCLLPIGVIVHDGEEMLTMPQWVAAHGDDLKHVAEIGWAGRHLVAAVPKAMPDIAITIAIEASLIVLVTAISSGHVTGRRATHVYAAALGVFVAHSLTHAVQPIICGGYTPWRGVRRHRESAGWRDCLGSGVCRGGVAGAEDDTGMTLVWNGPSARAVGLSVMEVT